jgi:hypothetical protein
MRGGGRRGDVGCCCCCCSCRCVCRLDNRPLRSSAWADFFWSAMAAACASLLLALSGPTPPSVLAGSACLLKGSSGLPRSSAPSTTQLATAEPGRVRSLGYSNKPFVWFLGLGFNIFRKGSRVGTCRVTNRCVQSAYRALPSAMRISCAALRAANSAMRTWCVDVPPR